MIARTRVENQIPSICIPIEFKAQGGGFYFLQSFEHYLAQLGWQIVRDPKEKADFLFTNHWMTPPEEIKKAIRRNPKVTVVQRIDGVAQDYGRADVEVDNIQAQVNRLADLTIFQSEYSRKTAREKYQLIKKDGPVIWNPVDLENFSPSGEKSVYAYNINVASVSWSANPRKGGAEIYACAKANPDIGFVLCGNFPNLPELPNLIPQGVLGRNDLAKVLRSCQALLTFSQNEACPNHVLEALACGCPVLYLDSGAMAEIIGDAGFPVEVANFRGALEKIILQHQLLSRRARARAEEHFNPEMVFGRYLGAMHAVGSQRVLAHTLTRWLLTAIEGIFRIFHRQ